MKLMVSLYMFFWEHTSVNPQERQPCLYLWQQHVHVYNTDLTTIAIYYKSNVYNNIYV